jgi:hypothetical protein
MRRWFRDEAGQLEIGAGILVLLGLLAIPLVMAGAKDIDDFASGRWNPKEKVATPPPVSITEFKDPALPAKTDPRYACYVSRAGSLKWNTARGWTHPDYPAPKLTGVVAKDAPAVAEWTATMSGLIAAADFKQCDLERESPRPPPQEPGDLNVEGTYQATFTYQGGPRPPCSAGYTRALQVSQPAKGQVRIAFGESTFEGTLSGKNFEASYSADGPTDRMRGSFQGTSDRRTIESGFVGFGTTDVSEPCAYTFEAERTGR